VRDKYPQPKDEDIRQALKAGEYHRAFEQLLERYKEKVFHLAFSLLRHETQAEDMAQEVFLRIWKGLPGYTGQASLSTWVYTICRNTCLTELGKRANRPTVSLHDPVFEHALESIPSFQSADRETGVEMDVTHLLSQLPEKYREVITLFYLEQKSYEEVSALLAMPLGTVKTFLFRAKRELLKIGRRFAPVPA
jgi:RNA polymerase sigma-70 factor, ECF subfamily